MGRADEQIKLGGRRIELGEIDSALQSLPGVAGAAAAVRTTGAGHQLLVGYVVPSASAEDAAPDADDVVLGALPFDTVAFDPADAVARLRKELPAALVPLLAVVDTLPTRTSGKVDRAALPWPLPAVESADADAAEFTETEAWLAGQWTELLGAPVSGPDADFFASGGGSLAAAQLVSRIRERFAAGSVGDIYQNPTLGALARTLEASSAGAADARDVTPVPRRTGIAQTLLMLPLFGVAGLRWGVVAAAVGNVIGGPWAPAVSWWWVALGWLLFVSPVGKIVIAAGGARLLLRGLRPGTYPRGGRVHLRLWTAERLAEMSGATSLAGAWLTYYARALGVRIGEDVDLHALPPVTGMLRLGKGCAVEPEVDLSGHWLDGDRLHIGSIRIGAGATVGARSTFFPGTRIGKRAEVAPGSGVTGTVPAGERWSGVPATRKGKANRHLPDGRPPRRRRWIGLYSLTSLLLGLLPAIAALPGLLVIGLFVRGSADLGEALTAALAAVPLATVVAMVTYALIVLAGVRLLSIGLREGYYPVHGRVAWQAWATERLMDMARVHLFPLYASLFTPVWLRALGMKVGRRVEASTVLALPAMTTVGDGAFLADDTMVASYELGGGWLRIAEARIGKKAFLGNSGMTAMRPLRAQAGPGRRAVVDPEARQGGQFLARHAAHEAAPGGRSGRPEPYLRAAEAADVGARGRRGLPDRAGHVRRCARRARARGLRAAGLPRRRRPRGAVHRRAAARRRPGGLPGRHRGEVAAGGPFQGGRAPAVVVVRVAQRARGHLCRGARGAVAHRRDRRHTADESVAALARRPHRPRRLVRDVLAAGGRPGQRRRRCQRESWLCCSDAPLP